MIMLNHCTPVATDGKNEHTERGKDRGYQRGAQEAFLPTSRTLTPGRTCSHPGSQCSPCLHRYLCHPVLHVLDIQHKILH